MSICSGGEGTTPPVKRRNTLDKEDRLAEFPTEPKPWGRSRSEAVYNPKPNSAAETLRFYSGLGTLIQTVPETIRRTLPCVHCRTDLLEAVVEPGFHAGKHPDERPPNGRRRVAKLG